MAKPPRWRRQSIDPGRHPAAEERTNRPKKKASLLRHLKSGLGKEATFDEAAKLLERLSKAGHLLIDEKGAVSYRV